MAKENIEKTDKQFAAVEETIGKTEQFIEKNQKTIMYVVGGLVAIILLAIGYMKYIKQPKELEAYNAMLTAEKYFNSDSIAKALNGDGIYLGFVELADEYSGTKSGNLANFYAGICYMNLAQYDTTAKKAEHLNSAIEYLEDFDADETVFAPTALGSIGDAYLDLDNKEKAMEFYEKAVKSTENVFSKPLYLMKAGQLASLMGNHEKALEFFNLVKTDFFSSFEGRDIKKYIAREEQYLAK